MRKLILVLLAMPFAANADPIPTTLEITTPGALGENWQVTIIPGFPLPRWSITATADHLVTVGFDDGTLATFEMEISPSTGIISPEIDVFFDAIFNPVGGALGTLSAFCDFCLLGNYNAGPTELIDLESAGLLYDPLLFTYIYPSGASVTLDRSFLFPPTSVPEPGTLALLGIGLAGMGLARLRKNA